MRKKYKVFASMWEDSNEGWVWIPPEKGFEPRDFITVKETKSGEKISCICRIIDPWFLDHYNQPPRRYIDLNEEYPPIVLNDHYRRKLGRKGWKIETDQVYELEIKRVGKLNYYRKTGALLHHPNNVVSLATFLAVWSVILGGISILLNKDALWSFLKETITGLSNITRYFWENIFERLR